MPRRNKRFQFSASPEVVKILDGMLKNKQSHFINDAIITAAGTHDGLKVLLEKLDDKVKGLIVELVLLEVERDKLSDKVNQLESEASIWNA